MGIGTHDDFILLVRQQPERARLCSFKEENETIDRRPVDPPPVVQLLCPRSDEADFLESTSYFIRANIVHPQPTTSPTTGEEEYHTVKTPTGADATAGEVIQTPERLKALDGHYGALVIFAKLSVRVPGIFRLKFTLYETTEAGIVEIVSVISDTFEVFSPKLFKGMKESTALTRHLASQGLKVKLRTDTTVGRQGEARKKNARTPNHSTPTSPSPPLRPIPLPSHRASHTAPPLLGRAVTSAGGSGSHMLSHSPLAQPTGVYPPMHSAQHGNSGYRSAPPPPPGPSRGLVWLPAMNHLYPEAGYGHPESSSSRTHSPMPHSPHRRRAGDDGLTPSLRDISMRYDYTPTPPSSDLSAFSLSLDTKRPDIHPFIQQPTNSSSSSQLTTGSRPYSPFSMSGSNVSSQTGVSIRSESPGILGGYLPPLFYGSGLNIGSGDDGMPMLPAFLRPVSHAAGPGPVLPPPLPSFLSQGQPLPVISPPPVLPPIRRSSPPSAGKKRR